MIYKVGEIIPNAKGHPEGCIFDIDDSGARLVVYFYEPTTDEIEQFGSGHRFELRYVKLYNVIMILTKIGNLDWMDAPYNPNLSKNLTHVDSVSGSSGLSLTLLLVDSSTGILKHFRLIGLSTKFTNDLFKEVKIEKNNNFDVTQYGGFISQIFNQYTSKELVKLSSSYFKLKD